MVIDLLGPLYMWMVEVLVFAYSTLPIDILEALMGLAMCFFGGTYVASIAAVEAFYMLGWDTTRSALEEIYEDVRLLKSAHDADEKKNEAGDGKADVQELSPAELLQRKMKLAAVTVRDPEKLTVAIGGLYTGWVAVQGTLRLQFAKTITMGVSIASMLDQPALRYGVPVLTHLLPAEYQRWIPTLIRTASKALAVAFAWYVQVTQMRAAARALRPRPPHAPSVPTRRPSERR